MKLHPLTWIFGTASLFGFALNLTSLAMVLGGHPTVYIPDPDGTPGAAKLLQFGVETMVSLSFLGIAANVEFLSRMLRTLQEIRTDKRFD